MRILSQSAANDLLSRLGMELDAWHKIVNRHAPVAEQGHFAIHQAPRDALALHSFSQHLADWLPQSAWYLFQIDDNTVFTAPDEQFLIAHLLSVDSAELNQNGARSFLFEFGADTEQNRKTRLIMASLIFYFLLFEQHANMVSGMSTQGEILALQDGFAYFIAPSGYLQTANKLIAEFTANPLQMPEWVMGNVGNN